MEAPDKVFFPNDINLLTKLSLVIKQKGDVCYIRKDALLEWAQEKLAKYVKLQNEKHQDPTHWGQRNAFQQMIDKLNSM